MFKHILVVCTGNICRSPMAEALLHKALPGRDVKSAGTGAVVGWGPPDEAQQVMQARGFDIGRHRARQLSAKMLIEADLVLVMEQAHRDWILKRFPQYRGKVHKLLKWREDEDIDDPYGQTRPFYEKAYEDIAVGVADWLKRL